MVARPLTPDDLDRIADLGAERDDFGPVITADWGGRCRGCSDGIDQGDRICWSEDDEGYVHAECAGL